MIIYDKKDEGNRIVYSANKFYVLIFKIKTKEGKTTDYFYDTREGDNGAAKAIYNQLSRFAAKALCLCSISSTLLG